MRGCVTLSLRAAGGCMEKEKFTPESIAKDKAIKWEQARVLHGGKFREVRYKESRRCLGREATYCD